MQKILIILLGVASGLLIGYWLILYTSLFPFRIQSSQTVLLNPLSPKKQVIGFLPYWLLGSASMDYAKYISTLTYFGLRIDTDGTILRLTAPTQGEPGFVALNSGKVEPFLQAAQNKNVSLSLLVSSGDNESINRLIDDPAPHAQNFVRDVTPLLEQYKFTDLNLDIEYTQIATPAAQKKFTQFVQEVRKDLNKQITLTVEIGGNDVIRNDLIDPRAMAKIADYIVLMAYDFHSPTSFVSGPVAPLGGAGIISEYDVTSAAEKALLQIPSQKLILGVPLYGYEWQTLNPSPRSANIPNSGVTASNRRAETLIKTCTNCSLNTDNQADERYLTFFDAEASVYHIIFYPDKNSTISKINLANNLDLGGLALWALGYEGETILQPLINYR